MTPFFKVTDHMDSLKLPKSFIGKHEVILDDVELDEEKGRMVLTFVYKDVACRPIRRKFTNFNTQAGIIQHFVEQITGEKVEDITQYDFYKMKNTEGTHLVIQVIDNHRGYRDVSKVLARIVK